MTMSLRSTSPIEPAGAKPTAANGMTVTALARQYVSGNKGVHTMAIYRASTLAQVAAVSVDTMARSQDSLGFQYVPLATTVYLLPNTAYYLMSSETAGQDSAWDRVGGRPFARRQPLGQPQRPQVHDREPTVALGVRQQVGLPVDGVTWPSRHSGTREVWAVPAERAANAPRAGKVEDGDAAVLRADNRGCAHWVQRHH